jgi:homoserine kinase
MKPPIERATASAPASIGNVGVGFDVLGLAFDAVRDRVSAHRTERPGVELGHVDGLVAELPHEIAKNCALAAAAAVLSAADAKFGVRLDIHKGIPMSAGMGGSAASAVAAAGAVNTLLDTPFSQSDLLPLAMEGERVSSDPPPWDNVMAALHGGLVIAASLEPPLIRPLPLPDGVSCVLFHPDRRIETRAARACLSAETRRDTAIEHARNLGAFIAGCTTGRLDLLEAGLRDILIEPQRIALLPELTEVQAAAHSSGALGCSFSGSGPSVFAWARCEDLEQVATAMAEAFAAQDCPATRYDASLRSQGLQIETRS